MGYKDTVVAFPGQITRIKAKFDIAGLYVWHCHIVEHEDNEMMRPFMVKKPVTLAEYHYRRELGLVHERDNDDGVSIPHVHLRSELAGRGYR